MSSVTATASNVSVWGVPELSVNIVVRPDGKITLPAVGDVAATGLTPVELSRDLTKVLDSYVKKPIVTVAVAGVTNNRVYISGGGVPSTSHQPDRQDHPVQTALQPAKVSKTSISSWPV